MKNYLKLANKILKEGNKRKDRTGTGTLSLFGEQLKFELDRGFPLMTTKKMYFKGIVGELLWFLRGEDNISFLQENDIHFWDAFANKETKAVGAMYGWEWIHYGAKPNMIKQPEPKLKDGLEKTFLNIANGKNVKNKEIKKTWEGIINRCYNKSDISYKYYGGKGVYVSNEWLEYSQFEKDVKVLPGYEKKIKNNKRYVIDKDIKGNGFCYSKENCLWVTDKENTQAMLTKEYVVEKNGKKYKFNNINEFCNKHKIDGKNFIDLFTNKKNAFERYGFKLVSIKELKNEGINQIKNVIDEIKNNPYSRRHLVVAYNPAQIKEMSLPPCPTMFQFYVKGKELSMHLYQRSADMFLGVPFDIAVYALLTHLIAIECKLKPKELIISYGDVHIYLDHIDQIKKQLKRRPYLSPDIKIKKKNIFGYQFEDIKLINYNCHEKISGKISV